MREVSNLPVCPSCGTELFPVTSVSVVGRKVPVAPELNIYQCPNCERYFQLKDNELYPITVPEIVEKENKLVEMAERIGGELYKSDVEIRMERLLKIADWMSTPLFSFMKRTKFHRAYTPDEILEACMALGFNPKEVSGNMLRFIQSWLYEHKGQWERKEE